MSTEPPLAPAPPPTGGGGWLRPVALILACLVLGFVGGWILRGDDGTVTVLDAGAPAPDTTAAATDGETPTAPTATTAPATTAETPPPARSEIALVVLNGTDTAGLAAATAAEAESVGYTGVTTGNAPTSTDPSTAYHATGQEDAAGRVARDLRIDAIAPLPASGAIADAARAADPAADVVVVLGP
jgi:hypothetical protein